MVFSWTDADGTHTATFNYRARLHNLYAAPLCDIFILCVDIFPRFADCGQLKPDESAGEKRSEKLSNYCQLVSGQSLNFVYALMDRRTWSW